MSGRNAFSKLTKDFTPEQRKRIEARKAEFRASMLQRELQTDKSKTPQDGGKRGFRSQTASRRKAGLTDG